METRRIRSIRSSRLSIRPRTELSEYVDSLENNGRHTFTRQEALNSLGISGESLQKAARRLTSENRLARPRRDFFLIIPKKYHATGAQQPSWYIEDLMKYHGQPYYAGLLSAGEFHGAAHHRPQVFEVITTAPLPWAYAGRGSIWFFTKHDCEETPTVTLQTPHGPVRVSTPEATAIDLLRYIKGAGHIDNAATVLHELSEEIDRAKLLELAKKTEIPFVQRLGYLLDLVGWSNIADPLADLVAERKPRTTLLRPERPIDDAKRDARWRLLINDLVDPDI